MPYAHRLTDDEKRELLRIARATLKEFFASGRIPPGAPHRKSLTDPASVVVSLFDGQNRSRGAMAHPAEAPLYRAIQETAIAAASRDPRVEKVKVEELRELTIEVAVLGESRAVPEVDGLRLPDEGARVSQGGKRGQQLPGIAADPAWGSQRYFEEACRRAALDAAAWQAPDALLEAVSVQVFDDRRFPAQPTMVFTRKP
jgi:hypothetical protein